MHVMEAPPTEVWIDEFGLLRRGGAWVALPDTEWRLLAPLVDRLGLPVSRDDLADAAWPGRRMAESALSVRMRKVRQRVAPLGLEVLTVRGRGYVLSPAN